MLVKKKKFFKLVTNKNFIYNFKIFVNNIINYEVGLHNKSNKAYNKLVIFLKIFFLWKIFIKLWNKFVKNYKNFLIYKFSKELKNFFMVILLCELKSFKSINNKLVKNLKNYKIFIKQTYLLDLHLYWILYFYSNIIVYFYYISFLFWLGFFFLSNKNLTKNSLSFFFKKFYNFKDLYKNSNIIDSSYDYIRFANLYNFENFFSILQKNILFNLYAQYSEYKKKINHLSTIFDKHYIDLKHICLKKPKKYLNFYSTIYFEHDTRWSLWRSRRRVFPKNKLHLII